MTKVRKEVFSLLEKIESNIGKTRKRISIARAYFGRIERLLSKKWIDEEFSLKEQEEIKARLAKNRKYLNFKN